MPIPETLRYFQRQIELTGVKLELGTTIGVGDLADSEFDEVDLAAGITPRTPAIDHPKVLSYLDVLKNKVPVGKKVAIIGAGGIGFDIAEYLTHGEESPSTDIGQLMREWGVDMSLEARGGIEGVQPVIPPSPHQVSLLQRKASKVGGGLGKTTG